MKKKPLMKFKTNSQRDITPERGVRVQVLQLTFNQLELINPTPRPWDQGTGKGALASPMDSRGSKYKTHCTRNNRAPALVQDFRQLQEPHKEGQPVRSGSQLVHGSPFPPHPLGLLGPSHSHTPLAGPSVAGRHTHTPKPLTAVSVSPHPLLRIFHFPPDPGTRHPHSASLPTGTPRSSIIT